MKKLIAFLSLCIIFFSLPTSAGEADSLFILINAEHPLPEDYVEIHQDDFVEIAFTRNDGRPIQKMRREAAHALDDAAVESYLARGMTKKEALRLTKRYYALPGESEHESGLAADIHHLSCATLAFADTAEYRWLSENAHKYGYILRYPEGKESVTGIAFEPWHFRYVGREAAEEIYRTGLCLEEFLKEKS